MRPTLAVMIEGQVHARAKKQALLKEQPVEDSNFASVRR